MSERKEIPTVGGEGAEVRAERCETCRFWEPYNDFGYCRRFPPVNLAVNRDNYHESDHPPLEAAQPATEPDDWCGEWKAKDETLSHVFSPAMTTAAETFTLPHSDEVATRLAEAKEELKKVKAALKVGTAFDPKQLDLAHKTAVRRVVDLKGLLKLCLQNEKAGS